MTKPDTDLIIALYEMRPALLRRLALHRARLEWQDMTRQGRGPETAVEVGNALAHWLISEGLYADGELCACGRDVAIAIHPGGCRVRADAVTCPDCLKLLAKVSGGLPEPSAVVVARPLTAEAR